MSKGSGLLKYARLTRRQLISFALASAALNGLITASVGAWLAQTYSAHQSRRQSIEKISNLLYGRRTRAGMVASAIRRNADIEELRDRKRAYDDAYVAWNTEVGRNLFVIRDVMSHERGSQAKIERDFEDSLIAAMADTDRCITKAYDTRIANGDAMAVLTGCKMSEIHQYVLDCGSTFVNELDKLTRLSFLPFPFASDSAANKTIAEERILKGCAKPPAAAPESPPQPTAPTPATAVAPPETSPPAAPSAPPAPEPTPSPAAPATPSP